MTATSWASSSSSGGSRPGTVRASSVLPAPGEPTSSRSWPPARATSSAQRAMRLTAHLRQVRGREARPGGPMRCRARSHRLEPRCASPRHLERRTTPGRVRRSTARPGDEPCHVIQARPRRRPRRPPPCAPRPHCRPAPRPADGPGAARVETIGSMPGTGSTWPPSDSSPTTAQWPAGGPDLARRDEDADGDGHVVRGTSLAQVRRCEVDGDPRQRVLEAGVARARPGPARAPPTGPRPAGPRCGTRAGPGATSTSTRTSSPRSPLITAVTSVASMRPSLAGPLITGLLAPHRRLTPQAVLRRGLQSLTPCGPAYAGSPAWATRQRQR